MFIRTFIKPGKIFPNFICYEFIFCTFVNCPGFIARLAFIYRLALKGIFVATTKMLLLLA